MAQILFITAEDIKKRSPMGGNVDTDKYLQSVAYVQNTQLKPILGVELMNKLTELIDAGGAIPQGYQILLDLFVKDFLVNYAASDYAMNANYNMTNGGVNTYQPDNGSAVSTDEIIRLTTNLENKAKTYGQNMIRALRGKEFYNPEDGMNITISIPEYKGTRTNSNYWGWELGNGGSCNGYDDDWF